MNATSPFPANADLEAYARSVVAAVLELHSPVSAAELTAGLSTLGHGPSDINMVLVAIDDSAPLFATLSAFTPPAMAGFPPLSPLAALFIREGGADEAIEVAQARFGLSEAETTVLAAMVSGLTIADHANRRCISVHTARKQLASVMSKVGVSRQNQLSGMIDQITGRGRDNAAGNAKSAENEAARTRT